MRATRWIPGALLVLIAACGPAAEDDYEARMAREHRSDSPETGAADRLAPASQGEQVNYARIGETEVAGYLARPAEPGGSAVLVIHEWWGLNDNIRAMARRLADEGHLALAVDLYEGEVAADRDAARALADPAFGHWEGLDAFVAQVLEGLPD